MHGWLVPCLATWASWQAGALLFGSDTCCQPCLRCCACVGTEGMRFGHQTRQVWLAGAAWQQYPSWQGQRRPAGTFSCQLLLPHADVAPATVACLQTSPSFPPSRGYPDHPNRTAGAHTLPCCLTVPASVPPAVVWGCEGGCVYTSHRVCTQSISPHCSASSAPCPTSWAQQQQQQLHPWQHQFFPAQACQLIWHLLLLAARLA